MNRISDQLPVGLLTRLTYEKKPFFLLLIPQRSLPDISGDVCEFQGRNHLAFFIIEHSTIPIIPCSHAHWIFTNFFPVVGS